MLYSTNNQLQGLSLCKAIPDIDGDLVGQVRKTMSGKVFVSNSRDSILGYYPVMFPAKHQELRFSDVGLLFISYDLTMPKAAHHYYLENQLLISISFYVVIFMLFGLFIRYVVTKRVLKLFAAAKRFEAGDVSVHSGLQGKDEIAQIGEAFDNMVQKILSDQEALKRREEQYRILVEHIPDYVMRYDRQHRHIFANSRTLIDNKMTAEEFIGKTHSELGFAPDLCDIWEKAIDKVFETGQPQTEVFEWKNALGEKKCLEWRACPEYAPDGSIETVLGISRDITEQKQAEKALKESEVRYRIVADNTHDWEFWLSPEEIFIYISPSCKNTTGYAKEEFMADPSLLRNVIHPEERLNFDNHRHQAVQAKKPAAMVFRIICRDGTLRWIDHICQPVFDEAGRFLGTRGSNRDITKRKLAEDKLRDALAYTRCLIETSLDPLVTISADGKITDVNEATIKVAGISRERLIGTDFAYYVTEPEKARAGYQLVLSKGTITDYPLTIRHMDGKLTDVLYNASVYKDASGNVVGVFAAARDITERNQNEKERERLILKLEETLANVKTLSGMLPICASCKKIRDDKGYWSGVESYISAHSEVLFSHGICPECEKKAYEELERLKEENR